MHKFIESYRKLSGSRKTKEEEILHQDMADMIVDLSKVYPEVTAILTLPAGHDLFLCTINACYKAGLEDGKKEIRNKTLSN